jgi:hypothetical protein
MDTIVFKTWLSEASNLQAEMNNTISYQKDERLDWETNSYKLQAVVLKNGASAPVPL